MGLDALNGNGITTKIYYLIRDRATVPSKEPLKRVRRSRIFLFVVIQIVGFGTTMAITQTIGGFNLFIRRSRQGYSVIASRNRVSGRHLTAHTFAFNNHPEASIYR